jgi:glycosyltransferase involved in cell wall biosynthesis
MFFAFVPGLFAFSFTPATGALTTGAPGTGDWPRLFFLSLLLCFILIFYVVAAARRNRRATTQLVKALASVRFWTEYREHKGQKIAVVIPAYNEEENIAQVLERIPETVLGMRVQTYVVVDGGNDRTEETTRAMGVPVIVQPINRGGGAALRAGYEIVMSAGAEIVVVLDADGQHLPEEIPILVEPIVSGEADLVNGSRILGTFEAESHVRTLGVFVFNRLVSLLTLTRITDCSNSFRAIRAQTLRKRTLLQDQFHTSELLIETLKKGGRVKEVPVSIRRRQGGVTKKPRSLRYGWGFAKAIFSTWLR